jgi:hypothetical protein
MYYTDDYYAALYATAKLTYYVNVYHKDGTVVHQLHVNLSHVFVFFPMLKSFSCTLYMETHLTSGFFCASPMIAML